MMLSCCSRLIDERKRNEDVHFEVSVNVVEIYNEQIRDLLSNEKVCIGLLQL